jgi:hypothetical protein
MAQACLVAIRPIVYRFIAQAIAFCVGTPANPFVGVLLCLVAPRISCQPLHQHVFGAVSSGSAPKYRPMTPRMTLLLLSRSQAVAGPSPVFAEGRKIASRLFITQVAR